MPNQRDPQKIPPYTVHKRQKKRGRGKLAAALIVICLLVSAVLFLSEFFVFTPEGIQLAFRAAESPGDSGISTNPILTNTPQDDSPRISIDRGELPPEGAGPIRGGLLEAAGRTREEILSAAVNLKNLGYTAAVVPVKSYGAARISQEELDWAAEACETASLRFVAYLSCFRDDLLPREDDVLAVHDDAGNLFIDYHYSAWLNPYEEGARNTVLSNCRFAVSGGADELLLDFLCFPNSGNVSTIGYGEQDETPREVIGAFAALLRESFTVDLGAVLYGDDTFGEGASETKGQDMALFAVYFDRIWANAADRNAAQELHSRVLSLSAAAGEQFCAIVGNTYLSAAFLAE